MNPGDQTTMQLYSTEKQPPWNAAIVCRQSRWVALAALLGYVCLIGGVPAAMWYVGKLPDWLAVGIAAIAAIVFVMVSHNFFATLRRSNWTLALDTDGVWINLRSYRNDRLDPGDTVVHLSYRELASAARHVVHRSAPSGDGAISWTEQSLDLSLLSSDSGQLKQAIAAERVRQATRTLLGGLVTISGRSNHVPVTVPRDGLVRVIWKSRYDFVRPGLKDVLAGLSKYVTVLEDQGENCSDDWLELPDEQFDARILELVEAGDKLDAVKLLRLRRGYSLREAKQFVDELNGTRAPAIP